MSNELIAALERALCYSGNERSLSDCLQLISEKRLIPLRIAGQFLFVEVFIYPQKTCLNISYTSGDGYLAHINEILNVIRPLAKALDCSEITCYGRPGWAKVLAKIGAKTRYTVLALEV